MMNILWLPSYMPFPADNGCKLVISNRMIQAAQRNHNIYMITEGVVEDERAKNRLEELCKECVIVQPPKRGKFYLLKWFLTKSLNVGRFYNKEITIAIERILESQQIDIIIVEMSPMAINLLPIIKKRRNMNIPVTISQHNIESEAVKSKIKVEGISWIKKLYATFEAKKLFNWEKKLYLNDLIVGQSFVTENDMELFKKIFVVPSKCSLFCSPIGTNVPSIVPQEEKINIYGKVMLFPAAFDYAPNIHGAVWFVKKVLPLICDVIPEAKVVLAGRNPNKEVRDLASENVIVTGTVPRMEPYFERADIFIVPLFFGGGMKTKLVEMGCYGKPTVTTSSGLLGTEFQHGRDLIVEDVADRYAKICIDMLSCPEKYVEMSSSMRKVTEEKYLWKSIGEKYCSYLSSLID